MIFHILFANIRKNRNRFLLIICCLSISIGMMIASLSLILYLKSGFESSERSYWGTSDIIVQMEQMVDSDTDSSVENLTEYMIYSEEVPVECNSSTKIVRAFDFNDLDKMGIEVDRDTKTIDNGLVVSKSFLKEEHVKIGDEITLESGTVKNKVNIAGTFTCKNEFAATALNNCFFTTFKGMEEVSVNYQTECLIKMNDDDNSEINHVCNYLENKYGVNKVRLAFDESKFMTKYEGLFAILLLVSITLSLMCINIIYSIKKFIISLEAKQYAILRSIGGNSGYIISILGVEGVILGGVSAVFSIAVSRVFIWGLLMFFAKNLSAKNIEFHMVLIPCIIIINILIMAVINILVSRNIRKSSIKDILLTNTKSRKKDSKWKAIIWSIILVLNVVFMVASAKSGSGTQLVVVFILISILCAVNLVPYAGQLSMKIIDWPVNRLFGNLGYLANRNIQYNKSFVTNLSMLTISISIVLLINATLHSVFVSGENNIRDSYKYDVIMTYGASDEELAKIDTLDKVEDTYRATDLNDIQVVGSDTSIYSVDFVHDRYDEYRNSDIEQKDYEKLLNGGSKILLTNRLIKDLEVNVGDTISLEIMGKNNEFEIVGTFESAMNNGNFAIASKKDLSIYTETYVKVVSEKDTSKVVKKINSVLGLGKGKVYGKEDYIQFLLDSSKQMYNVIYYLSIIPLIISLIISVTNAIFTFYENKRNLFVLKSLGLSGKKVKKMYFMEQYLSGTVGVVIGIIFGSLLIAQAKWYMILSKNTMAINQSLVVTLLVFFITIVFSGIVAKIVVERIINEKLISEVRN